MGINWDEEAPEGATHYRIGGYPETVWRDLSGAGAKYWYEGKWHDHYGVSSEFCLKRGVYEARPTQSGWNGDGLPHVGAVCEVRADHIREGDWTEVKVLALGLHAKDVAVLVAEHADGIVGKMHCLLYTRFEDHFRPIKTKEQIAAEERESEVSHIERCITNLKVEHQNNPRVIAEVLHNIGYRKQENTNEQA